MNNEIIEGNINDLKPLADNPMKHGKRNKETTTNSIKEVGLGRSVLAHQNEDGSKTILAGHGTIDSSKEAGVKKVVYVPTDGETLVVVVREGMTEEEQYRMAMYDNTAAKQAVFDGEALENIKFKRGVSTEGIFTEKEFDSYISKKDEKPSFQPEDSSDTGEIGYYIIIECEEKDEQMALFTELTEEGYKVVKYEGNKRGGGDGTKR